MWTMLFPWHKLHERFYAFVYGNRTNQSLSYGILVYGGQLLSLIFLKNRVKIITFQNKTNV